MRIEPIQKATLSKSRTTKGKEKEDFFSILMEKMKRNGTDLQAFRERQERIKDGQIRK